MAVDLPKRLGVVEKTETRHARGKLVVTGPGDPRSPGPGTDSRSGPVGPGL